MSTRAPIHRKTPIPFMEQQVVDDNPAVGSDEAMQSEQMDYEDEEYRHNAEYEQEEEEEDDDEVTDDDWELRHNIEYLNKSRSVPRTPERRKLKPVAASPISLAYRNYSKNASDSAGAVKSSYKHTTTESTVTVQRKVQHTPASAGISKRRNSISRAPADPTPRKTERNRLFMPATALVLLAFVVCFSLSEEFFGQGARNKKKEMKYCKFDDIRERYAQQDEFLWKSLSVGIENILNKRTHSPGIFLFVHELGAVDVNKLVKDIAKRSTECFGQPMQLVEMKPSDFVSNTNPDDYGTTIEKYRKKMEKGHVVLVANLNQIPPQAARALHAICDTVTPLKEDIVIFLTLTTPQIKGNIVELAENSLFDLWSPNLKRYELDPLITRVTDQVFALRSS